MANTSEGAARASARRPRNSARLELVLREETADGLVERDLAVTVHDPEATVADLVEAVVGASRAVVTRATVDGEPVALDRAVRSSGLRRGSVLTLRETDAGHGDTAGETA